MRLTQKSWWLAALLGGLTTTVFGIVPAAPQPVVCQPPSVCPPGYFISVAYTSTLPPRGQPGAAVALCESPTQLVLGGGFWFGVPGTATVINSFPLTNYLNGLNGWRVDYLSNSGSGVVYVFATCLDPSILSTQSKGSRQ